MIYLDIIYAWVLYTLDGYFSTCMCLFIFCKGLCLKMMCTPMHTQIAILICPQIAIFMGGMMRNHQILVHPTQFPNKPCRQL